MNKNEEDLHFRKIIDDLMFDLFHNKYDVNYDDNFLDKLKAPKDFKNYCLLCREELLEKTNEHIFAKWMLRELEMYNDTTTIPNGTKFFFRNLTIPCCKDCNGSVLSKLENQVKEIFSRNVSTINEQDNWALFYWCLKIYIALAIKSTHLKKNLRDKESGTIFPLDYLNSLEGLFVLFQTVKYPAVFTNFKPFTIFSFNLDFDKFDQNIIFLTHSRLHSIMLGFRDKGFIVCFHEDNLMWDFYAKEYRKVRNTMVTIPQFVGIYARCLSSLEQIENRKKGYIIAQPPQELVRITSTVRKKDKIKGVNFWNGNLAAKYLDWCWKELER